VLYQCIQEIPELQFVIQSPVIKAGEKTRLFNEMFRPHFNPMTLTFINLVLERHREDIWPDIPVFPRPDEDRAGDSAR